MLYKKQYWYLLLLSSFPVGAFAQAATTRPLRQIPVLCYHHVQQQPLQQNNMFISHANFTRQMQGLYDSVYRAVLPEQLVAYYNNGVSLPEKCVVISFDDGHDQQYTLAAPVLDRLQWKGVFCNDGNPE